MARSHTPQSQTKQRTSRQYMIDSAIVLLRERGVAGTTIDAMLAHSGAPRGSVYHHFPGGRRELIAAAVTEAGDAITELIRNDSPDADPRSVLDRFADLWKATLVSGGHRAGCPVVAVVVDEGANDPDTAELAAHVLEGWRRTLQESLTSNGINEQRAERLATLILSAIEGALVLCRTQRSTTPLEEVIAELTPLLGTS